MKSKYSNSEFSKRHIGSNQDQVKAMLKEIGYDSMDEFIAETIPDQIRFKGNLNVVRADKASILITDNT